MTEQLPPGTEWAYGHHIHTTLNINEPIPPAPPRGLCGIGGCVFITGHRTVLHSWEKP